MLHEYEVRGTIHPFYGYEFDASLVGIAAASHALDALYGQLTLLTNTSQLGSDAGRADHIRERLGQCFVITNETMKRWTPEFSWLFDQRNAALHASYSDLPTVTHPSGLTNGSPLYRDYSLEGCRRAVDLMLDVLTLCAGRPRSSLQDLVDWSSRYQPGIDSLVTLRSEARHS